MKGERARGRAGQPDRLPAMRGEGDGEEVGQSDCLEEGDALEWRFGGELIWPADEGAVDCGCRRRRAGAGLVITPSPRGEEGSRRKRSRGDSGSTGSDATWSESSVRLIRLRAARRVIQTKGQVAFSLVVFQQQQQQPSSMTGSTTREAGSVQPVLYSMSSLLSTHHHLVIFGCFAWVTPLICTIITTVTIITTTIVSGQSFSKQRTFENRIEDIYGSISSCCTVSWNAMK